MSGLTAKEIEIVVKLLKNLKPGELPFEIFHQIARLYATPIFEIVPLRKDEDGDITTIVLEREGNDPVWPGKVHTPGTVIRANDEEGSFKDSFNRIQKNELPNTIFEGEPVFVSPIFHRVARGTEVALVYYIEYTETSDGEEVKVNSLPENLVDTQLGFIRDAVEAYKENLRQEGIVTEFGKIC